MIILKVQKIFLGILIQMIWVDLTQVISKESSLDQNAIRNASWRDGVKSAELWRMDNEWWFGKGISVILLKCSNVWLSSRIQPFNFSGVSYFCGVHPERYPQQRFGGFLLLVFLTRVATRFQGFSKVYLVLICRTWCMWWRLQINVTQREKRWP